MTVPAAVDVETESRIEVALQTLLSDTTSFVIAQRISTVLNADKIVVLDRGRIVAEGTHAELMERSEIYKEIYDSQLGERSMVTLIKPIKWERRGKRWQHKIEHLPMEQEIEVKSDPKRRSGAPGGPALPGPGGRGRGVQIERARDIQGTTKRLLAYLKPYRWSLIGVLILVVLSTLLSLAVPYLMGQVD